MVKNKLIIRFGDNDFGTALTALGAYLLREVPLEALEKLETEGSINTVLTEMFRSHCILEQMRWDMYSGWGSIEEYLEDIDMYKKGSYYKIVNAELHDSYSTDWDNGETLTVDYETEQVHMF